VLGEAVDRPDVFSVDQVRSHALYLFHKVVSGLSRERQDEHLVRLEYVMLEHVAHTGYDGKRLTTSGGRYQFGIVQTEVIDVLELLITCL
jgi:hypothetical protein